MLNEQLLQHLEHALDEDEDSPTRQSEKQSEKLVRNDTAVVNTSKTSVDSPSVHVGFLFYSLIGSVAVWRELHRASLETYLIPIVALLCVTLGLGYVGHFWYARRSRIFGNQINEICSDIIHILGSVHASVNGEMDLPMIDRSRECVEKLRGFRDMLISSKEWVHAIDECIHVIRMSTGLHFKVGCFPRCTERVELASLARQKSSQVLIESSPPLAKLRTLLYREMEKQETNLRHLLRPKERINCNSGSTQNLAEPDVITLHVLRDKRNALVDLLSETASHAMMHLSEVPWTLEDMQRITQHTYWSLRFLEGAFLTSSTGNSLFDSKAAALARAHDTFSTALLAWLVSGSGCESANNPWEQVKLSLECINSQVARIEQANSDSSSPEDSAPEDQATFALAAKPIEQTELFVDGDSSQVPESRSNETTCTSTLVFTAKGAIPAVPRRRVEKRPLRKSSNDAVRSSPNCIKNEQLLMQELQLRLTCLPQVDEVEVNHLHVDDADDEMACRNGTERAADGVDDDSCTSSNSVPQNMAVALLKDLKQSLANGLAFQTESSMEWSD